MGMYLFAINTADDVNYVTQLIRAIYGPSVNPVKVNGAVAANGTWFTYTPTAKPVYSGIQMTGAGNCLAVSVQYKGDLPYFQLLDSAETTSPSFCEFNRIT